MKKLPVIILCGAMLLGLTFTAAYAQASGQLMLGYNRDFGYSGFSNDIQGLFTLKIVDPPQNLSKVEFFIDKSLMGEDTQAPFTFQFNTDSYPVGSHTFSATGYLADGTQMSSNPIPVKFVPASAATGSVVKIVGPILGLLLIVIIVSLAIPMILNKGKLSALPLGTQRKYGIGGGAICPKCGRPFPLRLWYINLGTSKIDHCPYCGRWGFFRPRSLSELRAAEQAELVQAQSVTPMVGETEAEKLKKDLDDSRYQDV